MILLNFHRIHEELNRLTLDIFSLSKIGNNLCNNTICNSRKKKSNPIQYTHLANLQNTYSIKPKQSPPPTHPKEYLLYLDPN